MRRRSKNNSGNKNNMPSKAKKSKPSEAEDVTQAPSEASRPESPMEVYISDYELPSEAPSTSQDTSNKAVELIETEQLAKIHEKVNLILDKCFLNQSEMVVNRRVLEDIVSDTLGLCYSEEDKNMIEVRNLAEKCKTLQAEQIKLNRQRFALRKQVEDAKHIIKKLIDEKHLYNRGIIRRILPTKRKVRTVGLQVCMVGPMFVSKPVVSYSTAITNRYTESTMPPVEPQTARKRTFNKEIDVRKNNEPSTSKVNPNQSANIRTPSKKGNSSGIISNITTRRMSQESSNSKALPIKENPISRELNTNEESAYSGALKKGSNFDSNSKRTPVRKSKLEEPELEYIKPTSSVKTRSMGGLKKNDIKNVNQVGKLSKAFNKGSENGVLIHEEGKSEVIIKEEVVDDIVEISEDEEMEETISEMKEVVNISDKKEAAIQVGVNKYSHGNSFAKSNEASSSRAKSNEASSSHAKYNEASSSHTKSNTASSSHAKSNEASSSHAKSNEASSSHAKSNEASSSQCAGPLIKVRSPEFINEQFIKSLNSSGSTSGVEKNVSFCQLPKYPISPKYPPYVSKPPAPILQIGKKSNIETQGIMLTWNFANKKPENIVEYQLFAYQEKSGRNPNDAWKKVGDIKALPLPMACYLSQFVENETYHFIIRAVDIHKRVGDFSIPAGIKLQKLDPSLKTPSGTLFKVPSPQN